MGSQRHLFRSASSEHLESWALDWAGFLPFGAVLALQGELGAGKTTMTRGLVQAWIPQARVSSPTFGYLHLYEGRGQRVAHFDCYRIQSAEEFQLMGWDEVWEQVDLTIIEWPERIVDLLPERTLYLHLEHSGAHRDIWQAGALQVPSCGAPRFVASS
jgi:tRNA threonylcarbamoyl adenosine modification protein YjeE